MIDNFNRDIIDEGNGIFSVEGITIDTNGGTIEDALNTFNAMPPRDYKNPEVEIVTNVNADEISRVISSLPQETIDALRLALGI